MIQYCSDINTIDSDSESDSDSDSDSEIKVQENDLILIPKLLNTNT